MRSPSGLSVPQAFPGSQVTGLNVPLQIYPGLLFPARPLDGSLSIRTSGGRQVVSGDALVPCQVPGSLHSLPCYLPRPPPASGSAAPRKLGLSLLSGACACSGPWQPGSRDAHALAGPGQRRPGQEVRAHGGAGLTCSGAQGSGQSHWSRRTPPSSTARPTQRAARRPGDRGPGSGRGLLRSREGLGEWAGIWAELEGAGAWP